MRTIRTAAEEEVAFAQSLCTHPVSSLIAVHRVAQDGPKALRHDPLFAVLQSQHRDQHSAVAGAADPADLDGRVSRPGPRYRP